MARRAASVEPTKAHPTTGGKGPNTRRPTTGGKGPGGRPTTGGKGPAAPVDIPLEEEREGDHSPGRGKSGAQSAAADTTTKTGRGGKAGVGGRKRKADGDGDDEDQPSKKPAKKQQRGKATAAGADSGDPDDDDGDDDEGDGDKDKGKGGRKKGEDKKDDGEQLPTEADVHDYRKKVDRQMHRDKQWGISMNVGQQRKLKPEDVAAWVRCITDRNLERIGKRVDNLEAGYQSTGRASTSQPAQSGSASQVDSAQLQDLLTRLEELEDHINSQPDQPPIDPAVIADLRTRVGALEAQLAAQPTSEELLTEGVRALVLRLIEEELPPRRELIEKVTELERYNDRLRREARVWMSWWDFYCDQIFPHIPADVAARLGREHRLKGPYSRATQRRILESLGYLDTPGAGGRAPRHLAAAVERSSSVEAEDVDGDDLDEEGAEGAEAQEALDNDEGEVGDEEVEDDIEIYDLEAEEAEEAEGDVATEGDEGA